MGKKVLYEGPDISYHNGCVNIKKVRDEGYKRVGIRAGYGRGQRGPEIWHECTGLL